MVRNSDLYADPTLATLYDQANPNRPDYEYCRQLANGKTSLLDLGCGTGSFAMSLPPVISVTAADPADAMLTRARNHPDAARITWINGDARTLRLNRSFDLITLTGHSFQVFLTRADQLAVLRTIAAHLGPKGQFIFDSRNPACPARKTRSKAETLHDFDHPELGQVTKWNRSSYATGTGILTYTNSYKIHRTGQTHHGKAKIRYTPKEVLETLMTRAGLKVSQWLGDWLGTPYNNSSPEIIPLGQHA